MAFHQGALLHRGCARDFAVRRMALGVSSGVGYSDHVVKPGVLRAYALLLLRCRSEAS
jgi:hypothetical protein